MDMSDSDSPEGPKTDRLNPNIRVVSPSRKVKLQRAESSKSRHSSASSVRSAKRLNRLRSNLADRKNSYVSEHRPSISRSITLPYVFDDYDLKKIHEEAKLKRHFRETLSELRCQTTPAVSEKAKDRTTFLKRLDDLSLISKDTNNYIYEVLPDVTDDEKFHAFRAARKKSIEHSGLWQMASASVYEYKARKSHDMGDMCMAMYSKKVAIDKMRRKISRQLELPGERFRRISVLRQNVNHIETRFRQLARTQSNTRITQKEDSQEVVLTYQPPRFKRNGEAVAFFRKCGRIILIVLKWIDMIMKVDENISCFVVKFSHENNSLERELKSFIDIANEVEETNTPQSMGELSFDKAIYKANKEISLTQEHRTILTTRWNFRTPEMVKQVLHGLQALRSLSEYPLRTQEKLCKVAWYQKIGPKKAIVRQGHHAESFYFILSGTAYVKKLMQDPKTGETRVNTIARLTKGQSFGEIGLLFNTLRTATVESATPMEVLVIGKEDFNRIFMKAEDPEVEPEHVTFLREIPLMVHWPVDILREEPGSCLLHYFKRGSLITDDNKKSEWLYFVRTGTCDVLKKLRNVKPRSPNHIPKRTDPLYDIILPQLGSETTSRINTGHQNKRQKLVMNTEVFEEMAEYYEKLKRSLSEKAAEERIKAKNVRLKLPRLNSSSSQPSRIVRAGQSDSSTEDSDETDEEEIEDEVFYIPAYKNLNRREDEGCSRSRFSSMPSITQAHFMLPTSAMIEKEKPPPPLESGAESYRPSDVFVRLEVLQAKDAFGLNTLTGWGSDDIDDNLKDSPAVSLVSRGAEVVMLSKKVFLRYLNDKVKIQLRDMSRPYPKEKILQENFQIKSDWELYKKTMITNHVNENTDTRTLSSSTA